MFALVGSMILWGSSFPVMKLAVTVYDPLVVLFGRMVVASALFVFFYKRIRNVKYRKGDWKLILLMAFFEPCIYFIFEGYALTFTTASQAGMVAATLPLITAVTASAILREVVTARTYAGFVLAIAGVCLLSIASRETEAASNPLLGNFLEFLAMVSACGYFIACKHLTSRYNPWFLTAMQAFIGLIFYGVLLLTPLVEKPDAIDPATVWMFLYLGSAVTIVAYGLYNLGISLIPVSQASAYINLIPVIAALLGFIFLDESFTPLQYAASGLVLLGVYLSQSRGRRRSGPRSESVADSR
jgi:drug/metabolite transporter (DMT)-like permease